MRNKTLIVALALAVLSGIAFTGEPDHRPDGPGRHGNRPRHEMRYSGPRYHARGPMGRGDRRGPGFGPRHGGPGCGPLMGFTGMGGMGMGGPGFGPLFMDELNLSADQTDKIIDLVADSFRDGLKLRVEMRQTMKKAMELRKSDNVSADAVIAINRDLGELRGRMEALRIDLKGKIESVLTPEQVEKMKEFRPRPPRPGWFGRDVQRPFPPRHDGFRGYGPQHRWGDARWNDEMDTAPDVDIEIDDE